MKLYFTLSSILLQWIKKSASANLKKLLENEGANLTVFIPVGPGFEAVIDYAIPLSMLNLIILAI